ncbi:MAG TPA: sterol desaturase family protein [Polyangia bacterium]|jgi:sterol desaturase/sphingolipid hydroxylase (fatty acid hydroxylase superfamily)|nr:sterol desaturase family protein [Polyangia bacterium]
MEKVLGVLPPFIYLLFLGLERLVPARPLAPIPRWRLKGLLFFLLGGLLVGGLPAAWTPFARAHRLLNLEGLGTWAGAAVAIVVNDLLGYAVHRLRHRPPLWRLHQMHHSAERLDVAGAFYFHPLDTVVYAFTATFLSSFLVGVSAPAAALAGSFGFLIAVFEHANVRTPRWLGFIVQRPEAHAIHHQRGVHGFNYGGLALWDAVFGTYRNPRTWDGQAGFWDGASRQLWALLVGTDVTHPVEVRGVADGVPLRPDAGAARRPTAEMKHRGRVRSAAVDTTVGSNNELEFKRCVGYDSLPRPRRF